MPFVSCSRGQPAVRLPKRAGHVPHHSGLVADRLYRLAARDAVVGGGQCRVRLRVLLLVHHTDPVLHERLGLAVPAYALALGVRQHRQAVRRLAHPLGQHHPRHGQVPRVQPALPADRLRDVIRPELCERDR